MNYLKKSGLIFALAAFCLSLLVVTSYAQGRAGWKNRNGNSYGWTRGQRNGWDNGRKRGWRNRYTVLTQNDRRWRSRNRQYIVYPQYGYRRSGRITPQEYWRLQRQRTRIYRTQNRYYNNDGYLSGSERRRLQKRYLKYRRSVYRDRRDW